MLRQPAGTRWHRRGRIKEPWHGLLLLLLLLLAAVAPACWLVGSHWRAALPAATGGAHEDRRGGKQWIPVAPAGLVHDALVDAIVDACAAQQNSWISTELAPDHASQRVLQLPTPSGDASCPLLFIPLAGSDRSIGLCSDAALYVNLLGAWIVPGEPGTIAQRCHGRSGVLFLEPLYDAWLHEQLRMPALWAPNFEQVAAYDREAHLRMRLVLCKVVRCRQLMAAYLSDIGSNATLLFTGHTSLNPAALLPGRAGQAPAAATPAAAQPLAALHVRGKSGLKHTKELLECWSLHPEWPRLTVVGPLPNEQISGAEARRFLKSGNIVVPRPGKPAGPGWPLFDPLSSSSLAALLLSHPLHILPSEREGFGHAINQGRAAGALLLVPDHPPMSELVRPDWGLLIRPERTFSHRDDPVPALGRFGNISASVSSQGICAAVAQALALSSAKREAMGRRARAAFEQDRQRFGQQVALLKPQIQQLLATS